MNTQQNIMTNAQLLKSVIVALVIGILVLVTAVLPAEYGIDPLGTGKLFGFSKLYVDETKTEKVATTTTFNCLDANKAIELKHVSSPKGTAIPINAINAAPEAKLPFKTDSITVNLKAGKGIEYKVFAHKYEKIKYTWATNKNLVFVDFHGEPQENPSGFYESYTVAYSNNMGGTLTVPFKGIHGWYFKNKSNDDISISIILEGNYELIKK